MGAVVDAGDGVMSIGGADNREVLDYDKTIVDTVMKLEDRATQFSLQNYAASGAVFLALFTTRIPVWIATLVVVILWFNLTAAMIDCFRRIRLLLAMHNIARNCWLDGQSKLDLRSKLAADQRIRTYLEGGLPNLAPKDVLLPPVFVNLIPLIASIILLFAPESWYSPRPTVSSQSITLPVLAQPPAAK
jgi:hypothetical protein